MDSNVTNPESKAIEKPKSLSEIRDQLSSCTTVDYPNAVLREADKELAGKGIGKLLFDKLIEEARERKFKGIVWQALEWNESAINFYKKYEGVNFNREWIDCTLPFEK